MLRQLISRASGAARRRPAAGRGTGTMGGGRGGVERGAAREAGKVARGLLRRRR